MSKYVCEMRYEGKATPTLAKAVEVKNSRALSEEEVDHSVILYKGAEDVTIDLPDTEDAECRGFHFVNLGTGKLTVKAPPGETVAGKSEFVIPAGRCLVGAHDDPQDSPEVVIP